MSCPQQPHLHQSSYRFFIKYQTCPKHHLYAYKTGYMRIPTSMGQIASLDPMWVKIAYGNLSLLPSWFTDYWLCELYSCTMNFLSYWFILVVVFCIAVITSSNLQAFAFVVIRVLLVLLLSLLGEEVYWTKESACLKILISKSKLPIPNSYCGSPMVKKCLTRKMNQKRGLWIFWFLQPNHGGLHVAYTYF